MVQPVSVLSYPAGVLSAGRGAMFGSLTAADVPHPAWLLAGALAPAACLWALYAMRRRIASNESELLREKERAEITLHSISDGVIRIDADGRVDYMNPVAEQYTGWSCGEARGQPLEAVYHIVEEQTGRPLAVPDEAGGQRALAVRLIGRHGTACAIRDSTAPIRNSAGRVIGRVVVFHDVSQIQEMAQQLTWQASHDALTGLVNRREFERCLAELLASARSEQKEHALLYMDLDNFKTVNDTCGHAAGDELLRQLTTVMLSKMRAADILARIGGDEFGALLEACPPDQAVRIANGMREAVRDFRFIWEGKTFGIGVSIGLVVIDADSGEVSRMLAAADATCYEAKNRGRDRVHIYRPKHDQGEQNADLQMVSQINHAFELGNFRLYRQPIIPLGAHNGDELHYEILVRMVDRSGNLIPPSGFMPSAERFNLLSSIERWVISSLVEHLHRECEHGAIPLDAASRASVFYAVNLSGVSINDNSFPDFLTKLLTRFNLPAGLLCFEVTETAAISNLAKATQLMRALKAIGCHFALDDFGTGMSSFAYLKYLPVDYIKIDGVFIRDMASDPMDCAIVEAINRIAHILGLKTVAEFVEDQPTLDQLRTIGIDYAQGFFIAEPESLVQSGKSSGIARGDRSYSHRTEAG